MGEKNCSRSKHQTFSFRFVCFYCVTCAKIQTVTDLISVVADEWIKWKNKMWSETWARVWVCVLSGVRIIGSGTESWSILSMESLRWTQITQIEFAYTSCHFGSLPYFSFYFLFLSLLFFPTDSKVEINGFEFYLSNVYNM